MSGPGRHVTLDGWCLRADGSVDAQGAALLADVQGLARLLDDIVEEVGMVILKPAEMLEVAPDPTKRDTNEDCGGVTGVVILTTSHGSLHTWPLRGQISLDLYSCCPFDAAGLLELLRQRLRLSGGTWRSFERGHDPRHAHTFMEADALDATTRPSLPRGQDEPSLLA